MFETADTKISLSDKTNFDFELNRFKSTFILAFTKFKTAHSVRIFLDSSYFISQKTKCKCNTSKS